MGSLAAVLRTITLLFLSALALIVAVQLLTGRIGVRRLLHEKRREAADVSDRRMLHDKPRGPASAPAERRSERPSLSRIQLLVVTVGVAGYLLTAVLRAAVLRAAVLRAPTALPDLPTGVLLLTAASHALYLARKFDNLVLRRPSNPR